jgi:hypothetical protein
MKYHHQEIRRKLEEKKLSKMIFDYRLDFDCYLFVRQKIISNLIKKITKYKNRNFDASK